MRSLPADECGMVLWIVKTKLHLVKDVVNDHGGVNNIEVNQKDFSTVSLIILESNPEYCTPC